MFADSCACRQILGLSFLMANTWETIIRVATSCRNNCEFCVHVDQVHFSNLICLFFDPPFFVWLLIDAISVYPKISKIQLLRNSDCSFDGFRELRRSLFRVISKLENPINGTPHVAKSHVGMIFRRHQRSSLTVDQFLVSNSRGTFDHAHCDMRNLTEVDPIFDGLVSLNLFSNHLNRTFDTARLRNNIPARELRIFFQNL